MAFTKIVGAGIHTLSNVHTHNVNSSGIITATKFVGPFDGSSGDFSGNVTVDGNLVVNGDTTTLNTTLREVELLRVDANSSTIAGIITQSGSGHALYVDGTTILGNSQYVPSFSAATQLAVANLSGNNNSVDITILGGRTGKSIVKFGDHDSNDRGSIQYHHTDESLRFFNNASTTEKLTIASTGHVGIGTTNPTYLLEVWDSDPRIQLIDTDLTSDRSVQLRNHQGTFVPSASNHTTFYNGGSERVRIKSTGQVGIGTNNPQNKFEVYGTDATVTLLNYGQSSGGLAAWSSQRLAFVSGHQNDNLVFGYSNSSLSVGNFVERMRIDNGTGEIKIANS